MYKMYHRGMLTASLAEFRNRQSSYITAAQREPVELRSRSTTRRAVVVSPEFFDAALAALEDQADIRAAAAARQDPERITHEDLMAELGL